MVTEYEAPKAGRRCQRATLRRGRPLCPGVGGDFASESLPARGGRLSARHMADGLRPRRQRSRWTGCWRGCRAVAVGRVRCVISNSDCGGGNHGPAGAVTCTWDRCCVPQAICKIDFEGGPAGRRAPFAATRRGRCVAIVQYAAHGPLVDQALDKQLAARTCRSAAATKAGRGRDFRPCWAPRTRAVYETEAGFRFRCVRSTA